VSTVDLDGLAELEEERRFLLRSLDDLEREFEAGDVERDDYEVLRDGYTARAANVLRAIEHGRATLPPKRPTDRRKVVLVTVAVVLLGIVSGWLMARSSGQRLAGQEMTGGQGVTDVAVALSDARTKIDQGDFTGALESYRLALDLEPENLEARTYSAWLLVLNTRSLPETERGASITASKELFERVIADDPTYADAHCLLAVTLANFAVPPDLDGARSAGDDCLAANPPAGMEGLVTEFVGGLAAPTSSVP
jgi:tetratricopeptide (TPR) repeat protein